MERERERNGNKKEIVFFKEWSKAEWNEEREKRDN
jgi:hypothetical protein